MIFYRQQLFNPLNPIVHFWLHPTAHCVSAERVRQREVGVVTRTEL